VFGVRSDFLLFEGDFPEDIMLNFFWITFVIIKNKKAAK